MEVVSPAAIGKLYAKSSKKESQNKILILTQFRSKLPAFAKSFSFFFCNFVSFLPFYMILYERNKPDHLFNGTIASMILTGHF